jgi:hypothetical protein
LCKLQIGKIRARKAYKAHLSFRTLGEEDGRRKEKAHAQTDGENAKETAKEEGDQNQ